LPANPNDRIYAPHALQLTADDIADTVKAAETIKRMLNNLGTIVQGSAELRNEYGTGHGKSKTQARQGLKPRQARLAVGAASTLGVFLWETHEERIAQIDATYGHLVPDSEEYLRGLLDTFDSDRQVTQASG